MKVKKKQTIMWCMTSLMLLSSCSYESFQATSIHDKFSSAISSRLPSTAIAVKEVEEEKPKPAKKSTSMDIRDNTLYDLEANDVMTLTRLYELGPVLFSSKYNVQYRNHVVRKNEGRILDITELTKDHNEEPASVLTNSFVGSRERDYSLFPYYQLDAKRHVGLPIRYFRNTDNGWSLLELQLNMEYSAIVLEHTYTSLPPESWIVKDINIWKDEFEDASKVYSDIMNNMELDNVVKQMKGIPSRVDLPEQKDTFLTYDLIYFLNKLYESEEVKDLSTDEEPDSFIFIVGDFIVYGSTLTSDVNVIFLNDITENTILEVRDGILYKRTDGTEEELGELTKTREDSLIQKETIIPYNMRELLLKGE